MTNPQSDNLISKVLLSQVKSIFRNILFKNRFTKILTIIFAVFLLLYIGIVTLLTSDRLSHWIVNTAIEKIQTPSVAADENQSEKTSVHINLESIEGNFFSGLTISGQFQSPQASVDFQNLSTRIQSRCLWKLDLCIENLSAETIHVLLQPPAEPEKETTYPIQLPEISLPVSIDVDRFFIENLKISSLHEEALADKALRDKHSTIEKQLYQAKNIETIISLRQSKVDLKQLSLTDDFCQWSANLSIQLVKKYPLDSILECQSVQQLGQARIVLSNSVGDLKTNVEAIINTSNNPSALTESPLSMSVKADLKPLDAGVPLTAIATLSEPARIFLSSQSLDVIDTELHVEGLATSPSFSLSSTMETDLLTESVSLESEGNFVDSVLSLSQLIVKLPQGEISTTGTLSLGDAIQWQGDVQWSEIDFSQWTAFSGSDQFNASANGASPELKKTISGTISGNAKTELQIATNNNSALTASIQVPNLVGEINQQPINANAQVQINNDVIDIESLMLSLANNNRVSATGSLNAETMQLDIDLALNNLAALLSGKNSALGPDLGLQKASGKVNGKLALRGDTKMPNVEANLQGVDLLVNQYTIEQSNIQIDWNTAEFFSANSNANDKTNNAITIDAKGIRGFSNAMDNSNANITVNGNFSDHRLSARWISPPNNSENVNGNISSNNSTNNSASVQCAGQFPNGNNTQAANQRWQRWVGVCDDVEIIYDWQGEKQRWALTNAIEIDYTAKTNSTNTLSLSVSTFCFAQDNSKVCNQETLNYVDGDIASLSVAGEQLPLAWVTPFLPRQKTGETSLALDGSWEFVLQGEELVNNNRLTAELMTNNAELLLVDNTVRNRSSENAVLSQKIKHKVAIQTLKMDWLWDKSAAQRISWELQADNAATLLGHLNVEQKQLDGEVVAKEIRVKALTEFFLPNQTDVITGGVNGQLTLTGSLDKPVFNGQLDWQEGSITSSLTPLPIKDINVNIAVVNNAAKLDGEFYVQQAESSSSVFETLLTTDANDVDNASSSNSTGNANSNSVNSANKDKGRIKGNLNWRVDSWDGDFQLTAEAIRFQPEPKMTMTLSPDLRLTLSPETINLTGTVKVPRARVEIETLPEQAISESKDVVIVGEQIDEASGQQAIEQQFTTSLSVQLGDDVQFKGFGLETNVVGQLQIQQNKNETLKTNGVLELQKGRYKAYGQNLLIQEGDLVFVGNIENPQLRVSAIRAGITDDVTVGLLATGSIANPRISLFSQPSMSQQAQLSYLLTGNAPGVEVSTDPTLAATEAALSYALASDVGLGFTKKAGEAFGIDDLQVTAGSSPANSDGGTQIGLSGYLTPKLMVRYGVGVFDAFNSLTLNYRLSKNLYLEVISGESSALDLLWSFERDAF